MLVNQFVTKKINADVDARAQARVDPGLATLLDPNNKRNYVVKKWRNTVGKFKSVAILHSNLKESFTDDLSDIPVDDIECGYIDPGHGAKGRQLWVVEKSDLDDMYEAHAQKKEIMIWFYTKKFACGKKRCASPITSKSMPNKVVRTHHQTRCSHI